MPVNWTDPTEIDDFRKSFIDQGGDSAAVEEYINQNTVGQAVPMSMAPAPINPEQKVGAIPNLAMDVPDPTVPEATPLPGTPANLKGGGLMEMAKAKAQGEAQTQPQQSQGYDPTGKTPEQIMAETGRQSELDQMGGTFKPEAMPMQAPEAQADSGFTMKDMLPVDQQQGLEQMGQTLPDDSMQMPAMGDQQSVLGSKPIMGTQFGVRQGADKYSGGVNYGTDLIVPTGTPVAVPPGEWKVVEAFNKAGAEGPNNRDGGANRGYGNSVLVQNAQTGEKLRMSHLTRGGVMVKPGQTIKGGSIIGKSGATGNTAGRTGQHLDLEYYNKGGKIADVMKSPYGRFIVPK